MHQAFGYSFVLTCLYFSPYPLFAGEKLVFCAAAGLAAMGAAIQFFLLRKRKKARWFPLLCMGALAVFEAQYQLTAFHVVNAMGDFFHSMFFGIVILFVLMGTALGWLVYLAYQKCQFRKVSR